MRARASGVEDGLGVRCGNPIAVHVPAPVPPGCLVIVDPPNECPLRVRGVKTRCEVEERERRDETISMLSNNADAGTVGHMRAFVAALRRRGAACRGHGKHASWHA